MDFRLCACGCGGELHAGEFVTDRPLPIIARPGLAPVTEPVPLDLVKTHLRVSGTAEDALLAVYVAAARRSVEAACERSVAVQDWDAMIGGVAGTTTPVELPWGPVREVTNVEALSPDGTTVPITGWTLVGDILAPPPSESWPAAPAAVHVTYTAGLDAAPDPLALAILLLVGQYYDHRAAIVTGTIVAVLPFAVDRLIDPYRKGTGLVVV